jgi:hypothetical protein
MLPLPCGDGTVWVSALIRLSSGGTWVAQALIRLQHLQQRRRGHPADGEFLRAIEELAPADPAVHVSIEQVSKALTELSR